MDKDTQVIYEELLRVAKGGETTYYSDIAPLARLNMNLQTDRNRIARILDSISKAEHEAGRPLLSAVVILRGEGVPGFGFFSLATELGLRGTNDEIQYWRQELQHVHDYWSKAASCV